MSATLFLFFYLAEIAIMPHPIVSSGGKKKGGPGEKTFFLFAASKLFHLGENIKRKSSKAVLLHSQCIAPPVTQAILVFQLCSPALPWHTGPDLLGKNCLERVCVRGSFKELI